MGPCNRCGNEYDKSFEVYKDGETYTFDSFECAIATLAPHCAHCDVPIIGHGLEADGSFFCCGNCAEQAGVTQLTDRV